MPQTKTKLKPVVTPVVGMKPVEIILPNKDVRMRCGKCHGMAYRVGVMMHTESTAKIKSITCITCNNTLQILDGIIEGSGTLDQKR